MDIVQTLHLETERHAWPQSSDEYLVNLVKAGHSEAFEILVKRYETRLYNYIRRMVGNAADAEDLFQETFIRVYMHLDCFHTDRIFRPWVYCIATNACRDHLRWWRRRPRFQPLSDGVKDISARNDIEAVSPGANPREKARESELVEHLNATLAKLSVRHRSVFLMARYENMTYDEIAGILGIPVGTVKSRMNKAVSLLMNEMDEVMR